MTIPVLANSKSRIPYLLGPALPLSLFCSGCRPSVPSGAVQVGAFHLQVAATPSERSWGLQGVKTLPSHSGMVFLTPKPERAVYWMKGCFIPLDIVYLDGSGKVQGIMQAPPPAPGARWPWQFTYYTALGPMTANQAEFAPLPQTTFVVEVPAGMGAEFARDCAHQVPTTLAATKVKPR